MAYVMSSLKTCAWRPPAFHVSVRSALFGEVDLAGVLSGLEVIYTGSAVSRRLCSTHRLRDKTWRMLGGMTV